MPGQFRVIGLVGQICQSKFSLGLTKATRSSVYTSVLNLVLEYSKYCLIIMHDTAVDLARPLGYRSFGREYFGI
jgi:hypothetical protein